MRVENLLEPLDEGVKEGSESFLRFAVVQCALFVTLDIVSVPPNHERVRENALVVELLHQRVHVLLLGGVELSEVEHHGLHETFNSNLAIGFDQGEEGSLILVPGLDDVALALEDAAEEDIVLVFTGDVHDELGLAHLSQQVLARRVTLIDEKVKLENSVR